MRPRIRLHHGGDGSQWPAPMLPRWRADLSREAGGSVRRLEPALNQNLSAGNCLLTHNFMRRGGWPAGRCRHTITTSQPSRVRPISPSIPPDRNTSRIRVLTTSPTSAPRRRRVGRDLFAGRRRPTSDRGLWNLSPSRCESISVTGTS